MVVSRMAFLMLVLLFLSTTGCSGNEAGHLRVGRGRRSLTTAALSSSSSSSSQENSSSSSSQQVGKEVDLITDIMNKAIQDLNHAKEEQVKVNMEDFDSIVSAFAVHLTGTLRSNLGATSRPHAILNDDEILELVNQIKAELNDQAQTELEDKAKLIVSITMDELETIAEEYEVTGVSVKAVQEDFAQAKRVFVEQLKESIDDAAGTMHESMKEKTRKVVAKVIEETLKTKYGDRFTLDLDQGNWICIEESNGSANYFMARLPFYSQRQLDRITDMVNKAGKFLDMATAEHVQAGLENFDQILTPFANNLMISFQSTLLDDGTDTPPATFGADELLELVEQINAELHDQAQAELTTKAKDIAAKIKMIGIGSVRDIDVYFEFRVKAIQENVTQAALAGVEEMKKRVDEAATMIEERMQEEAPKLVATVVENKIKKKYSNRITVRVEENIVYIEEGDSSIGFSVQLMGGDGQGESATETDDSIEDYTDGGAQEVDQMDDNAYGNIYPFPLRHDEMARQSEFGFIK